MKDPRIKVTPRSDGRFVVLPTEADNAKRVRGMKGLGTAGDPAHYGSDPGGGHVLEGISRQWVRHRI